MLRQVPVCTHVYHTLQHSLDLYRGPRGFRVANPQLTLAVSTKGVDVTGLHNNSSVTRPHRNPQDTVSGQRPHWGWDV